MGRRGDAYIFDQQLPCCLRAVYMFCLLVVLFVCGIKQIHLFELAPVRNEM